MRRIVGVQNAATGGNVRTQVLGILSALAGQNPALRQLLRPADPRATSEYNDLYNSLGLPEDMPVPLPYVRVVPATHKYSYVTQGSIVTTIVVPAGDSAIVCMDPYSYNTPLRCFRNTGTGGATQNIFWDPASVMLDRDGGVDVTGAWLQGTSPFDLFGDGNAIKNVLLGTNTVPTNDVHPPLSQVIGTALHYTIAVPFDGQAVTRAVGPGTNNQRLGRENLNQRFDTINSGYLSLPSGFQGSAQCPHGFSEGTPIQYAEAYVEPVFMQGASPTSLIYGMIPGGGATDFRYAGTLDVVDAPVGNETCARHNISPRNNIADMSTHGMLVVQNSGSTPLTINTHMVATYAIIMAPDDSSTNISQLAGLMRLDANQLIGHLPKKSNIAAPSHGQSALLHMKDFMTKAIGVGASKGGAAVATKSHGLRNPKVSTGSKFTAGRLLTDAGQAGGAITLANLGAKAAGVEGGAWGAVKTAFGAAESAVAGGGAKAVSAIEELAPTTGTIYEDATALLALL
jgi:hypothetical protein